LVRAVPETVNPEVEDLWERACTLHPDWEHVTWRDPIDPDQFPLTSPYWARCHNGAQLAGLVRLEDLWHRGGVYLDADVYVLRPFDDLVRTPQHEGGGDDGSDCAGDAATSGDGATGHDGGRTEPEPPPALTRAFAAPEDGWIVPDAVLGAEAGHPVLEASIDLALRRLTGTSGEPLSWQTDRGAWSTGPGVTTSLWKGRDDVTILPREALYPVHYAPRDMLAERIAAFVADPDPESYCVHLWHWSWR